MALPILSSIIILRCSTAHSLLAMFWPLQFNVAGIDELRIIKGYAQWTGPFTPPNSAYNDDGVVDAYTYLSCSRASIGYAKTQAGTLTQFGNNQLRITDLGLLVEDARTNQYFFR